MNANAYHWLREQIEGLLTEGQLFGKRAAEWEKVETYWHIGDTLLRFLEAHGGSTHGQQTIANLSKDLHLGAVVLYDILRFRRQINHLHARVNLSWSHYRALLQLPPDQLDHYEQLAEDQAWTTRQLKQAIERDGVLQSSADELSAGAKPLVSNFATPYTYRVIPDPLRARRQKTRPSDTESRRSGADTNPGASSTHAIDFGFHHVWVPDQPLAGFNKATPGDTLDAVVDLGLGHRAFPRLRLRGIDTAVLYTQAGRDARHVVEQILANVPFILIATRRTDSYGRYLADVKYLADTDDPEKVLAKGTYLNRELLDKGLARPYP